MALRPLQNETCEMKRLFVSFDYRGTGAGRLLALAVMAKALCYQAIRLDTVPSMAAAIQIYKSLGFQSIEPYCENPIPGALFLECKL